MDKSKTMWLALGAAVLAASVGAQGSGRSLGSAGSRAAVTLRRTSGQPITLATSCIALVMEDVFVDHDVRGTVIRTTDGETHKVVEPVDDVLSCVGGLFRLVLARPPVGRPTGVSYAWIRPSAISAVRPSIFRSLGRDRRDCEVTVAGFRVRVRDPIEEVRTLVGDR